MRIVHVYPYPFEDYYPSFFNEERGPDDFDREIVCHTDLEVRYLAGLQAMGDHCTLLYPRRGRVSEKSFTHARDYEVRRFPITFFEHVPGRVRGPIMLGMLRYIREQHPDVVHVHDIYAGGYFPLSMLWFVAKLCRRLSIPVFGWYHIGRLAGGRGRFPMVRALYRKIRIHTLRRLDGITSINHCELEKLFNSDHPDYYGVDFSEIPHCLTHNTVDRRLFAPVDRSVAATRTGLDPSRRYLLFVSRLCAGKGLELVLSVLPRLRQTYRDLHLLVVGEFISEADAYKQEIEEIVRKQGMSDDVTFLGRIEHHQGLPEYYSIAEAFVLPTSIDSFAAVNIEALACETPVISTDREEIPYYLTPEVGILIPSGDEENLFKALEKVLSGRFVFNEQHARDTVARYDYRTSAATLREWYMNVGNLHSDRAPQ